MHDIAIRWRHPGWHGDGDGGEDLVKCIVKLPPGLRLADLCFEPEMFELAPHPIYSAAQS